MENFSYQLTDHAIKRIAERQIQLEWVVRVLQNPKRIEPDAEDIQLRHALGTIPEYGDRVLRVIYNETINPWRIVSVHFDRKLKGKL